jgi:hypothetical protein
MKTAKSVESQLPAIQSLVAWSILKSATLHNSFLKIETRNFGELRALKPEREKLLARMNSGSIDPKGRALFAKLTDRKDDLVGLLMLNLRTTCAAFLRATRPVRSTLNDPSKQGTGLDPVMVKQMAELNDWLLKISPGLSLSADEIEQLIGAIEESLAVAQPA